ncbi:MAG: adenylate/guanylate cyclase domain-containing protein [Nitrospirota bacterium]
MTKKSIISLFISTAIFIITITLYYLGTLERLDLFIYDAKTKLLRSDKEASKKIKVILIDEASLKALEGIAGRWPWPRAIWADLLEFLSIGGAKAVLFDILFTERQGGIHDSALVEATKASKNVYHSMMILREPESEEYKFELGRPMPEDFVSRFSFKKVQGSFRIKPGTENNNYNIPFTDLYRVSKGIGVVEFTPDNNGAFRRTKPLREYKGKYYPVLGIAPFIDDNTRVIINKDSIAINDRILPIDKKGNYPINMYGKVDAYSIGGIFASMQRLKKGEVEDLIINPEEFKDSIVFVGASAVGVEDLKPTPIETRTPGVLLHTSLASNYLMNDFLKPPNKTFTVFSVLIGAFLTTHVVLFSRRFLIKVAFPIGMLSLYIAYSIVAFMMNSVFEVIPFVFSTLTGSFISFGYLTFTEAMERRKVSQLFTQYVSKEVLDEILRHRKDYLKAGAGLKVEITVLFSDIRGFTTFSESTPPERVVEMLNCYFSQMAEIILKYNGTLDKYIGDAVMAFWGAPMPIDDHSERAVLAAIEMLNALDEVNKTLKSKGYDFELRIGIGVNTGIATIGNIGSEKKLNYTVVGDTVNLASRLEGLTKEFNSNLIISEYTYERIKDKITCKSLGNIKVKGREKPVEIYTPDNQNNQ